MAKVIDKHTDWKNQERFWNHDSSMTPPSFNLSYLGTGTRENDDTTRSSNPCPTENRNAELLGPSVMPELYHTRCEEEVSRSFLAEEPR